MKPSFLRPLSSGLIASLCVVAATTVLAQKPDPISPNEPKVTICHNGHSITVAQSAVPAHLAHGDTVGPCASESKVLLCHRGKTISVAESAVSTHLAHGDTLGECTTVSRSEITVPTTPASPTTPTPVSSGLVAPTGITQPTDSTQPALVTPEGVQSVPATQLDTTKNVAVSPVYTAPRPAGLGNPVMPQPASFVRPTAVKASVGKVNSEEVAVCYKGHTVNVARSSIKTYLSIGATLGPCADEAATAPVVEETKEPVESSK